MNKSLKLVCLALLIVAVVGEEFGRTLKIENKKKGKKKAKGDSKSGTGVSCSAFAAIKIVVTRGSCEGEAVADCKAIASSQSEIKKAYGSWWNKDGKAKCEVIQINKTAKAVATASAAAFAASLAKVSCEGKGFACGASSADAAAFAVSFARAIAQAAVDSGGTAADAFCMADVQATSGALAEAAASAHSQACVKDTGMQADFQYAMVDQITEAIATAFVDAMAATCSGKPGFAGAASKCAGKGTSTTKGKGGEKSSEKGSTSRKSEQQDACEKEGECCDPEYTAQFCKPTEDSAFWRRVSEPGESAEFRSWMMPSGDVCYCYTKGSFLPTV